jgi:hypothetical protein
MKPARRKTTNVKTKKDTMRDRIDCFFLRREKFRGYPGLCVGIVSSLVLFYAIARTYGSHENTAQLRFVENPTAPIADSEMYGGQTLKPVFAGEAHDTVQRLRECGALLMAVSLSAFEDFRTQGKFPAGLGEMLTGIQKRSLLPPGIAISNGKLHSSLSELKLSYRSDPFSFEIFSLPSNDVQGPAMLFQFPLPSSGANSVMYFKSGKRQVFPAPFSTIEQLAAAGWTIRHWQGETLPLDEVAIRDLQENDAWLKSQIQK